MSAMRLLLRQVVKARSSGEAGLQTAIYCASGAQVLEGTLRSGSRRSRLSPRPALNLFALRCPTRERPKKRPHPRMGPDDQLSRSKVGQRAREEDMRSAIEPGSREEDTIQIRCRDTEDRGRRIRCSSQRQYEYAPSDMNAQLTCWYVCHAHTAGICPARGQKRYGPARGESEAIRDARQASQGGNAAEAREEAPAVFGRYRPEQRASQLGRGNASHA